MNIVKSVLTFISIFLNDKNPLPFVFLIHKSKHFLKPTGSASGPSS